MPMMTRAVELVAAVLDVPTTEVVTMITPTVHDSSTAACS